MRALETLITVFAAVAAMCANVRAAEGSAPGPDDGAPPSFRRHVLPILSKHGCNSGACHGALAGKGGFRLSLRGYDPETDYHRITREMQGRRIELTDPARSLLLTKSTTALKHTGGRRIVPGSRDYDILAGWIAAGAPGPGADDPVLEMLEVSPRESVAEVGARQRLAVTAAYSDGVAEDVTGWAKFSSADESVATVSDDGEVAIIGSGEGTIVVWFSSRVVTARFSVPFPNNVPEALFAHAPRRNFIDDLTLDQLRRLRLAPSPRAGDAEFLRRAFLDAIGRLPSPDETRAFLADGAAGKRDAVIDALLEREEFVDYWTYRLSDILLVSGRLLRPEAVKAYAEWIRGEVANETPWDEFARKVVTAKGSSVEHGATNFYAVHQDPESMAENVSQAFLSLSISCARCHDHPLEKWTNDQYFSFANLFARVRAKGWGGDSRSGDGIRTVYVAPRGDLVQPRTGKPQPPAPLDADPIPADDPDDRRVRLADWLTSPDNRQFARSIANRVWANYFGIGLVEPVDDLRASNPASNEALLDALADHLVNHDFSLKGLMRVVMRSETYQRTSEPLPENQAETRYFSRAYPRRLMAEVLHDAIVQATGVPSDFSAIELTDGSSEKTELYPEGTRALELYDSAVKSYFLDTFGRNAREITCECERSSQPSLVQALHLSNGDTVNEKLAAENCIAATLADGSIGPAEIVEEAFLRTVVRMPSDDESARLAAMIEEAGPDGRRAAIEDLFWALMTSREFLFQR